MASFRVDVDRGIHKEIRRLPGNVRQRVVRALKALQVEPRPSESEALDLDKLAIELPTGVEPRRIRMDNWRIVYVIEEGDLLISVLAVRKRPPYQYDDLDELIVGLLG